MSVPVSGEDVEVMERFTYILAVIFMSLLVVFQRSIDIWVGLESHGFTGSWGVTLSVPM